MQSHPCGRPLRYGVHYHQGGANPIYATAALERDVVRRISFNLDSALLLVFIRLLFRHSKIPCMGLLMKFHFFRFSDEITADDNDVKFKQWNGRERSLYFEPRYDFDNFGHFSSSSAGFTQLQLVFLYSESYLSVHFPGSFTQGENQLLPKNRLQHQEIPR